MTFSCRGPYFGYCISHVVVIVMVGDNEDKGNFVINISYTESRGQIWILEVGQPKHHQKSIFVNLYLGNIWILWYFVLEMVISFVSFHYSLLIGIYEQKKLGKSMAPPGTQIKSFLYMLISGSHNPVLFSVITVKLCTIDLFNYLKCTMCMENHAWLYILRSQQSKQ